MRRRRLLYAAVVCWPLLFVVFCPWFVAVVRCALRVVRCLLCVVRA